MLNTVFMPGAGLPALGAGMKLEKVVEPGIFSSKIDLEGRRWNVDLAEFEIPLRKIGRSIYMRIPHKLVEKLCLREGQKIRLLVVTSGPVPVAGLLAYLGPFKIGDRIRGIRFRISPAEKADEIIAAVSERVQPTSFSINRNNGHADCLMEFGHVAGNTVIRRPEHIVDSAKYLLAREAGKRSSSVEILEEYEEETEWVPLDSSVIKLAELHDVGAEIRWGR